MNFHQLIGKGYKKNYSWDRYNWSDFFLRKSQGQEESYIIIYSKSAVVLENDVFFKTVQIRFRIQSSPAFVLCWFG